ncbi:GNAT family N-acetyltransferase [Fulvivirga sp. RKSG066]|uniref:bifunctional helix-turn-helix transcriptional regulator/GNAT family N-acetyltransferase n=1 Tax=Fulvivirga aurantia TaxID=2529383 RepID=UPI0012BD5FB7|nr:bifunctional helix-turn-helix transcriptional regulator/GNAT family N-acetyltransferase [Fulvivirga aurantia]MTI22592.1 GNAT family N-acetyltransferase [Fulvivirga aurantia]
MILDEIGEMSLGTRLRMLSETVMKDAKELYALYDVELKPKWFPVFYSLSHIPGGKSITSIANEIKHSHPSVIKIVKEMAKAGLVVEKKDDKDGRKNNIHLTTKGREVAVKIEHQYLDVGNAIKDALAQTRHNLWKAMQEFEYLLEQQSLYERVVAQRKTRETASVSIVEYHPKYKEAFKKLNEEWITRYFKLEAADLKAIDHPQENIIDKGGAILVAIEGHAVLGVCALLKMEDRPKVYELAKMAVSPAAQGKGIGRLLGEAIIDKARQLDADIVYLESNTKLKPAISLYEKLGFKKVAGHPTPYERANIQMELVL